MRLASGLAGEFIGVDGSIVILNVPAVGELKVRVVVAHVTVPPDAPALIVPDKVALYTPGFGEPSLGSVNETFKVKFAPFTEVSAVEVALNTPKVMFEDSPGFRFTLISFGLEIKVIVVAPIARLVPSGLTVPPELPAPNLPVVSA